MGKIVSEKSLTNLKLKIADIIIEVLSDNWDAGFGIDVSHQPFLVSNGKPMMTLKIHHGDIPRYEVLEEDKVFESGGAWSLYKKNGKYILPLQSPSLGKNPYKLAILDSNFKNGDIYVRENSMRLVYPLEYPLDEVLMVNLLSRGRGMEIHACGIIDPQGLAIAFLGTSGAGKSTLANLWKTQKDIVPSKIDKKPPYKGPIKTNLARRKPVGASNVKARTSEIATMASPVDSRMALPRYPMLHLPGMYSWGIFHPSLRE